MNPIRPQFQIQVRPDGPWHRPEITNGGNHTACGEPITGGFHSRDIDLTDNLCQKCFTSHEIETGKLKRLEKEVLERAAADEEPHDEFEDDEPTDPTGADR